MSDYYIKIISIDPFYTPEVDISFIRMSNEIFQNAENISVYKSDDIMFIDCGSNFNEIICPFCNHDIPIDWWNSKMDADYMDGSFQIKNF